MAIYNNDKDPNVHTWETVNGGEKTNVELIDVKDLLDFIAYEEALTKDRESAERIRNYFKKIGLWS